MTSIRPDLHLHSNASDGALPPGLLAERAAASGVTLMALTDHDTMDGVNSLRGQAMPIPVLPGVELSLRGMRSLHLLGYGWPSGETFQAALEELQHKRRLRGEQMLARLKALGMPLPAMPEVKVLGRAHMARAMAAAGYVPDVQTAFDRYLGEGCPAYVSAERLDMAQALRLMRQNGMTPVLAHPALLKKDELALRGLLGAWKEQGLMGVEVYHPSQAGKGYAGLERMVRRLGLLVTGGSDYHLDGDSHGLPGCTLPDWPSADQDARALLRAVGHPL